MAQHLVLVPLIRIMNIMLNDEYASTIGHEGCRSHGILVTMLKISVTDAGWVYERSSMRLADSASFVLGWTAK